MGGDTIVFKGHDQKLQNNPNDECKREKKNSINI